MGQTIACANQKGGVGKTTTVVNVGTYLALAGQRVLIVDVDPQGNATSGLGVDRTSLDATLYDVVIGNVQSRDAVIPTAVHNLFIIPSSIALAGAEMELAPTRPARAPPRRACLPADRGRLRLHPSRLPAVARAPDRQRPDRRRYGAHPDPMRVLRARGPDPADRHRQSRSRQPEPELEIKGVVLTMYDARTNLSADVAAEVRRHLGAAVFETVVPRSVRLSEAPSYGLPIALLPPGLEGRRGVRGARNRIPRTQRRPRRPPSPRPATSDRGVDLAQHRSGASS